jgi:tetratricopeptide (TPR) repeat protein/4-amino-4-deoxy-L-arabinose transferase-like glycosyltransferase
MNESNVAGPRRFALPLAVFAAALLVRVLAVFTSTDNPSFTMPITDAMTYDAVARHLWETGTAPPRLFWQPFLYPLQLAAVYAATDGSILAAKLVQAVVGAFTCLLVFVAGRRLLGRGGGLVAAVITVLHGPLVLFEGELLATGGAAFWSIALVLLIDEARNRRHPAWLAVLGAAAALAVLTRPTFAPFLLAAAVWLAVVLVRTLPRGRAVLLVLAAVAAFTAVAVPFAAWNGRVTGARTITPDSGGLNVHLGNNPDVCETLTIRPGVEWEDYMETPIRLGHDRPGERDDYFYGLVKQYLREDPAGFAAGLGRKALQLAGSREIPRNLDVYLWGDWSPVLRVLTWKAGAFGFPFGAVLPLAAVGLVFARRRLGAPVLLYLAFYAAAVVAVFVTARYRVPMTPVLALAAAGGVQVLAESLRERRKAQLGLVTLLVAAVVVLGTVPGPFCEEEQDMEADFWFCLGAAQFSDGLVREAQASFERSLRIDSRQAQSWYNLGVIAAQDGRSEDAISHYRNAVRLDPRYKRAHNNLAALLITAGDPAGAERALREALRHDPEFDLARRNLAIVLVETGRSAEALPHIDAVLERQGNLPSDQALKGKALLGSGRTVEAIATLQRALAAGADPVEVRLNLGAAQLANGEPEVALRQFEGVMAENPQLAWARTMAGVTLASLDRHPEAIARFEEALDRDPLDVTARFGLAKSALALGDVERARVELRRVLGQMPNHARALQLYEEIEGGR